MALRLAAHPFSVVFLLLLVVHALAQPQPDDAGCNGILLTYTLQGRDKIRPFVPAPDSQPYAFRANATVRNSGTRPLRSWAMLLTFVHGEILVSVDGAVLTSGGDMPYNTTAADAATSFTGYPQTDLLTPIDTAGDLAKIQATVNLVGTLFAWPEPFQPLPSALSLADPAYACPPATNVSSSLSTCCVLTPAAAAGNTTSASETRRRTGDLVITYDVLQAHETTYLALVTLDNNAPLGRLDGWQLSWAWQRGEFISSMRGAYPREVGAGACLYGPQGQYYEGIDFSQVLNCDRRPVVVDLPPSRADDADIGRIDHCCRNGTILPKSMDVAHSKSAFQMEVYKMPPDLNRTKIHPPASFEVHGASPLNPEYACGQPIPVSPSEFPDPSGLASTTVALASWQAVCNITTSTSTTAGSASSRPPRCCVSFSASYNESVIPCRTCACGCPASARSTCSTTTPSMLLPPYALLMPFERRAKEALSWAEEKRLSVPNPMPCGDSCGVSINWHVATDFDGGWSARLTLFNWGDEDMQEWFTAIFMDKAYDGFEQAYSFNATAVGNSTIFIKAREGFNFLLRETNMSGVDYPVPGKLQSVLSFTKKTTPGIDVVAGDGFPSKVFFNGDECAMPLRIPSQSAANRGGIITMLLGLAASALLLLL
ncbi:brittle stalk-2-like protein 8 precursor [Panicum miliaceum]|uniref:Brittle stalk-2-like protein 8 n=1 Tax=Panicum miliaceum TaxID=4540 RepID=A0A3L6QNM7_PANMI|nr:brittle stalk-2-like protein 8 precursor [Panicum miliaceum]